MSTVEQPEFVAVDQYLVVQELSETNSEYIDGWILAMSGATVRHNGVKMNCGLTIGGLLKGKPCH